jgi:hypothetical protein
VDGVIDELTGSVKNRRGGTAESDVPGAKMLVTMDDDWLLFSDARADPVCAFNFLRPDSSHPDAPVSKLIGHRLISPMVNSNTLGIAKQDDIVLLAYDRVQTVDFFLGQIKDLAKTFPGSPEFARGDDVRHGRAIGINMMFNRAASPGV